MPKKKPRQHTITMQRATGAQAERINELMHATLSVLQSLDATLLEGVEALLNVLVRTHGLCNAIQRQLVEEALELTLKRLRGEPLPEPLAEAKS